MHFPLTSWTPYCGVMAKCVWAAVDAKVIVVEAIPFARMSSSSSCDPEVTPSGDPVYNKIQILYECEFSIYSNE